MSRASKRTTLARMANATGCGALLDGLLGPRRLTVLAYHRIAEEPTPDFPWSRPMISASPAEFREQLDFLRRDFSVVSIHDVLAFVEDRSPLPDRAALITFDDGYLDNYTEALPALRERGLPASVFLTSGLIGTSRPLWWDLCCFAIHSARPHPIHLPIIGTRPTATQRERALARGALEGSLKRLPATQRDAEVAALFERLGLPLPTEGPPFMDWDQAEECDRAGFTCHAHTVTHPILTSVPPAVASREIEASIREVGERVGRKQFAFAYPNGGRDDVNDRIVASARAAGIRVAFMLGDGPASFRSVRRDPLRIPRIAIGNADRGEWFRLKVRGAGKVSDAVGRTRTRLRRGG